MRKRIFTLALAMVMILQTMMPVAGLAKGVAPKQKNMVKVGDVDIKSYPQPSLKIIQEANRQKKLRLKGRKIPGGARLFSSPYFPGQDPANDKKPLIYANVNAVFSTKGLDGGDFDWEGVFGKDQDGKPQKAQIVFEQIDYDTSTRTGVKFFLKVDKTGKYTWSDDQGKPTKLPLYSKELKPFKYEVLLDEDVTDHVKLLTSRFFGTEEKYSFGQPDPTTGEIVGEINLDLTLQQVASTKFTSKWNTDVEEANRPTVEGSFLPGNETDPEMYGIFKFPSNDTDKTIIRNDNLDPQNPGEYSEYLARDLEKTPKVDVADPDPDATDTYTLDRDNAKISYKNKTYKYEVKYDVINGGKLTMTEVIPVTFDANGGKFASITDSTAKQEIKKEVDYDGTLTDKAENPTKDRETFKGWSTTEDGKTPITDKDLKNIKKAKTLYAIWDNNAITADELTVYESYNDGTKYVNDFIPSLDTLKGRVKIKDADGKPQALKADDKLEVLKADSKTPFTDQEVKDGALKAYLYEKLQEKKNPNDEPTRIVKVKAKVTHQNGKSQTVDIPIKVIKNIYEAKTLTEKPFYVPEGYVKVTVDPTTKATVPQKTYYYVNPAAKVVIPGEDPTGTDGNVFTKWVIDGTDTEYKLTERHQFSGETTIEAQYEKEKQGKINIKYVDGNGKEIDPKYHKAGVDYPATKEGKLADYATEVDFPKPGPDFKGYIYSSRDSLKGKRYKDPTDPDNLDIVTYKYYKKVTTDTPSNKNVYFPVIFDANGGEFKSDTVTQKTVYVHFDGNDATVEKVTFKEVKDEFEKAYSNPTKDGFDFKEWQNAKTNGTKPADDYEIQFKGWDPTMYTAKKETFYAHYEKASALVKYLDLDGKPIADDFKIDGVEYPTEKTGKLDEAIASDVFTKDTAPKLIGYKFNRIEINPVNSKYALDNKGTIKIYYEKLPDVIPAKDGSGNPNEKPDGYVEVKFVPTDKAKDTKEKIFYVNPKKDVTIPIADPEAKATYTFKEWKMGADAKGAVYTPSTAQKFTEARTVITATYEETKNIIPYDPSVPDPMVRPEGYVRVTFAADPGLKLTEQKAYYVKKNAGITLGNAELVKPGYEAQTGYKFDKWDKKDDLVIETTDIVVTAKATKRDNVIPATNDQGQPNTKPEGYKEVTFVVKTGDEAKGSITGVAKFYVNPTEYVTINPPATEANTGYVFGSWDKDTTIPTVYKEDTTITGSFNEMEAVIPKTKDDDSEKPKGYFTVTFKLQGEGDLASFVEGETTVYYVDPNRKVSLQPPKYKLKTGWKFTEWDFDTTTEHQYSDDKTIYGNVRPIPAIIPEKDENNQKNPKPDGYVTVTFKQGDFGKFTNANDVKVFYVNPDAEQKLSDIKPKPSVTPDVGYKYLFWNKLNDPKIDEDLTVTAVYKKLDDVVPKENPKGGENEKPAGYIAVKFSTEANGKIKGTAKTEKIIYINPNKVVVLKDQAPEVTPNTGFTFADWDTSITKAIQYKDNDVIKAKYNPIGAVIPKISEDTKKPAGYVTVTFDMGTNGASITGTTVYYVDPNKEVTVPAPTVTPATGYKQKTGADAWDKARTQKFTDKNTKITAQYEEISDMIPQKNTDGSDKPEGYVTVKFKAVNGTLSGTTTYYVNGEKEVDLTDTAKAITKNPNVGYTAEGTWDKPLKAKFTDGTVLTFTFKALNDVIEVTPGATKPDGYITVKLIPTDKATNETVKSYWVNPNKKNVTIPSTDPVGKEITDTNDNTYTFTFKEWTSTRGIHGTWEKDKEVIGTFTQDTDIEAKYYVKPETLVNGPIAKDDVVTPKDDVPEAKDLIKNIPGSGKDPLPDGTTFNYKGNKNPDLSEPGEKKVVVEVHYPGGKTAIVEVPITVVDNVVPQDGGEGGKKPLVPDSYVKVTVNTTNKATDNTKFEKVFWVKPNVDVTIPGIKNPSGKAEKGTDGITRTYNFDKWKREGATPEKFYTNEIKDSFAEKTETTIVALYTQDENVKPIPNDGKWVPKGSTPSAKDFIKNPYNDDDPNSKDNLPPGTKFTFTNGDPDTNTPGTNKTTTITITYPNGEVKTVNVNYNVTGDVVEQTDPNKKPDVPDDFVEVIVKTTDKATDATFFERTFWVNQKTIVTIDVPNPTGKDLNVMRYEFTGWNHPLRDQFTGKTIITAQYQKFDYDPSARGGVVETQIGKQPTKEDYAKQINANGERFKVTDIVKEPDVSKSGMSEAEVEIQFENGVKKTVRVMVYVVPDPKIIEKPVPGDCNNGCDQPNVGKGALNTTDHYQYLIGYPDGNFAPNKGMTRAEVATMFTRLLKERPVKWKHYNAGLSDIRPGDWYADTVGYAVQKGIVSGYPDGSFKPNKPITRAEFASIASRFDALAQGNAIAFSDLAPSHWGYRAIGSAASKGWISGYPDNTFRPEKAITRAEVTSVTNRMLNRYADLYWIDAHRAEIIRFGDVKRSDWYFEPIMEATMGHDFIRDRDGKTEHWTGVNGKSFI